MTGEEEALMGLFLLDGEEWAKARDAYLEKCLKTRPLLLKQRELLLAESDDDEVMRLEQEIQNIWAGP
ncbi:MAG: hypothetical protein EBS90_12565 [Betaproteobacteria bacterium]|nr:hypothetical protein [Betaproteobacteria bacterium]